MKGRAFIARNQEALKRKRLDAETGADKLLRDKRIADAQKENEALQRQELADTAGQAQPEVEDAAVRERGGRRAVQSIRLVDYFPTYHHICILSTAFTLHTVYQIYVFTYFEDVYDRHFNHEIGMRGIGLAVVMGRAGTYVTYVVHNLTPWIRSPLQLPCHIADRMVRVQGQD